MSAHWTVELGKCGVSTDHARTTHVLSTPSVEQVTMGKIVKNSRSEYVVRTLAVEVPASSVLGVNP